MARVLIIEARFYDHIADGLLKGGTKTVHEISIVKKGARHECNIRGFAKQGGGARPSTV